MAMRLAPRKAVFAALLAVAAGSPLLVGGFQPVDIRAQVVVGALSVFLLSLAALQLISGLPLNARGIAHWRVGPWYLLWGSFAFGLASLTWLAPQSGSASEIALPGVVDALTIVSVSIMVWTVGYLVGVPQLIRNSTRSGIAWLLRGTGPVISGGVALPWVLYGLGSVARLAQVVLTNQFGYVGDPSDDVSSAQSYDQILHVIATCTLFAVATAAYRAAACKGNQDKVTLAVLFVVEVAFGGLQGSKQTFALAVLAVLVPYGAVRGKTPLRFLITSVLIFLLLVLPFNVAYRESVTVESGRIAPSLAVSGAPTVLSGVLEESRVYRDVMVDSSTTLVHRVREIDNVAIITQLTPSVIPYRNPWDLAAAPVIGLIPRALWPGKPVITTGYDFTQEYYGGSSDMYTSSAVTPVGDLYRHGGWITLVIGMLLMGVACRLFDTLIRPEADPWAIFFLLVFLPILVKSEMSMYDLIISVPVGILTAALGARLTCRGQHHGSAG
ncbi:MAG: hypothetical protein ACRDPK_20255 [Carbonactinosporaceae bacterium]